MLIHKIQTINIHSIIEDIYIYSNENLSGTYCTHPVQNNQSYVY